MAEKCFMFPIELGKHNGKLVVLCRSKNYYLKYDNKTYSIENYNNLVTGEDKDAKTIFINDILTNESYDTKNFLPSYVLSLEHAITVIEHFDDRSADKVISKDIVIKYGKFGPYIKYKNSLNVPIPFKYRKSLGELTEAICLDAIDKKQKKEDSKNMSIEERKAKKAEDARKRREENKAKKIGQIRSTATKPKPKQKKTSTIDDQFDKLTEESCLNSNDPIIKPKRGRKVKVEDANEIIKKTAAKKETTVKAKKETKEKVEKKEKSNKPKTTHGRKKKTDDDK
jgi:hypothetical protein